MRKDFMLEIGCENLPSGYLGGALNQLGTCFSEGLKEERIPFDSLRAIGTPNRLVVHVQGVSAKQEDKEEKLIGPPVVAAVTPEGTYTKAAEGFARSQGVPLSRLTRVETEKGEYIAALKRVRGRSVVSVLKEMVPRIVNGIKFPKLMRWNASAYRFARPIRWVVAFMGENSPKLEICGLRSGRSTRLSPYFESSVELRGVDDYFSFIKKEGIILEPERRRDAVRSLAKKAASDLDSLIVEDEGLVEEVANLLEKPVALSGGFDKAFLKLPREVVVTALKSHQRYFSVQGRDGKLKPYFIAFADGAGGNSAEIARGYERVLQARLADADFYYREDTSRSIEGLADKLEGIVWLEGLGNLAQKAERIERIALWLHGQNGTGGREIPGKIARASRFAKADLASEMVKDGKEFTLLQGYIGREYARVSGEAEDVAESIFEHYLPRFSGDRLPEGGLGVLLALADRIDTIAGCFILGLEPSGSQDPYALRRQALGLLRIAIEREVRLSVPRAFEMSIELYGEKGFASSSRSHDELLVLIGDFLTQRLSVMLRRGGVGYDLVAALLAAPWEDPYFAKLMVKELQRFREKGELTALVLAFKRIINIIPRSIKARVGAGEFRPAMNVLADRREGKLGFSPGAFREKAESDLYEAAADSFGKLRDLEEKGKIHHCFEVLAGLVPAVNMYFDDVLVNCDDEGLRRNRIAFLTDIYKSLSVYCDFSIIVVD